MSDVQWKIVGGHLFARHPECGPEWAMAKANDAAAIIQSVISSTKEQCAQVADDMQRDFLSPQYATDQPWSSHGERFACKQIASAIRSLQITGG